MRYQDFNQSDQSVIDAFLMNVNATSYTDIVAANLADDEVFFITREGMEQAVAPYIGSPGSYGAMAAELASYFNSVDPQLGALIPHELDWGTIARVGDGRYIVMSDSWSDSGLFRDYMIR